MPRKSLHYDFKNSPSLAANVGPTLSLTRATTAKMKDADGWLREVQSGEARFPSSSFSHNLLLQSSDFDTTWASTRVTVTGGQADPFGGTDAWSLNEDGTAANNHFISQAVSSISSGHDYVYSMYVKASNRSWVRLANNVTNDGVWFDVTNGATGSTAGSPVDYGIEDVGGGWYRCWLVISATTGTTVYAYIGEADGDPTFDGLSQESLVIYGAQVEDVSGAWDSENLLLQSNDFDTSWAATRLTPATGSSDPDGGTAAWSISEDGTAATTHTLSQSVVFVAGTTYFMSLKAKASNRNWFRWCVTNLGITHQSYFNLSDGSTGTTTNATAGTTDLGGGWYECWIKFQVRSDDVSGVVQLQLASADGTPVFDGLSQESILIYKAQVERCKPSQTGPGTYTATTTAAVTNYSPSAYIATTTAAVSSLSGANDGLLVEEARTNICLQSEDLSTTWVNTGTVDAQGQSIAPDGSLTANLLSDDGVSGDGFKHIYQSVTVATSTAYCFSVYCKADQTAWAFIELDNFTTPPSDTRCWFDLSSGAVGSTPSANLDDQGIEDIGNGWYRCWVVFTTDATDTTGTIRICMADSDNDIVVAGDGSHSFFVWGAMLEAGAFPTSHIPTTTGSVSRNADLVEATSVSGLDNTAASIYLNVVVPFPTVTINAVPIDFAVNGGAADRVRLYKDNGANTGHALVVVADSGTKASIVELTNPTDNDRNARFAAAWDVDDVVYYADGTQQGTDTDTSGVSPDTINEIHVGKAYNDGNVYTGLIKEIAYWGERLDNGTLEQISTDGSFPSEGHSGVGLGFGKMGAMGAQ